MGRKLFVSKNKSYLNAFCVSAGNAVCLCLSMWSRLLVVIKSYYFVLIRNIDSYWIVLGTHATRKFSIRVAWTELQLNIVLYLEYVEYRLSSRMEPVIWELPNSNCRIDFVFERLGHIFSRRLRLQRISVRFLGYSLNLFCGEQWTSGSSATTQAVPSI